MKKLGFIFFTTLLISSCGSDTSTTEKELELRAKELELKERELALQESNGSEDSDEAQLEWNYSGTIGNIPIKAQINYQSATHNAGSGAVSYPITGYYFYNSEKIKIPLEGSTNGIGRVYLEAYTSDGSEYFDGDMTGNAVLGDFSGNWSKGNTSLAFILRSK